MKWTRIIVYAALIVLALLFLVPLGVVVVNSLRSSREIAATSLIGWPSHLIFSNYAQAWNKFCMAEHCWGIEPYMLNSLTLAIPATIISTLLGALAGYSISLWRFRGDQFVFAVVTLGIFLPEQMKLIPWVVVLRDLSLMNTIAGLVLIHTVQGMSFTTLFCRNYYVGIPQDLLKAARIDGAGFFRIFWRIILPLSPPILIVTVIFQFTGIWNEFLYGVTSRADRAQRCHHKRTDVWRAECGGADRGTADAAGVSVRRTIFPERPHCGGREMMGLSWQR